MATDLLTAEELAAYFRVKPGTISKWAMAGEIPRVFINSKTQRYRLADVMKAIERRSKQKPV